MRDVLSCPLKPSCAWYSFVQLASSFDCCFVFSAYISPHSSPTNQPAIMSQQHSAATPQQQPHQARRAEDTIDQIPVAGGSTGGSIHGPPAATPLPRTLSPTPNPSQAPSQGKVKGQEGMQEGRRSGVMEPRDKENHQTTNKHNNIHRSGGDCDIDTATTTTTTTTTHPTSQTTKEGNTAEGQGVPQDEVKKVRRGPDGGNATTVPAKSSSPASRAHRPLSMPSHANLASSATTTHQTLVPQHQQPQAASESTLHGDTGVRIADRTSPVLKPASHFDLRQQHDAAMAEKQQVQSLEEDKASDELVLRTPSEEYEDLMSGVESYSAGSMNFAKRAAMVYELGREADAATAKNAELERRIKELTTENEDLLRKHDTATAKNAELDTQVRRYLLPNFTGWSIATMALAFTLNRRPTNTSVKFAIAGCVILNCALTFALLRTCTQMWTTAIAERDQQLVAAQHTIVELHQQLAEDRALTERGKQPTVHQL